QHPKIEEFGEYLLIVIRRLYYDKKDNELKDFQISVIVGDLFIITFQEQVDEIFDIILERIIKAKGKIRQTGSDYLVYRILDSIVDSYFVLLENLSKKIDLVEDLVIKEPSRENIQAIHTFKRDVLYLHKSIWPLREIVNSISRIELPYLKETNNIYFRDVQNHIIQIIDSIDIFREMLNGMFEIYLSSISNRLNQIMKILTIISTIFIPLSFIASLYGMNFRYMPELQSPIGYYIVVFVMIFIGLFMLIYFKKKDWF
ncbi:MAG TPA: magnesium/cobalt transporter CorA, partial [Candidatus Lokiarchaeia archaeon]